MSRKYFQLYYDLMSQPSRAIWIALKMGKILFEECPVALRKLEQYTDEYKKINRFQKVPAIVDGDFHLSESVAIVRYLSAKGCFSEQLYPKDLLKQIRVDEFLEWQHLGVRYGCGNYFLHMWLLPTTGRAGKPSAEKHDSLQKEMERNLKILDKIWLNTGDFIIGKQFTVADLFAACEIEQTKLCQYDVKGKYSNISKWLDRVYKESHPYFQEAHDILYRKAAMKL